jgi:WD40 repeat protein
VAFSPDSQRLAAASIDHTAKIWDPATGSHVLTLQGHIDVVLCVAFSPDGKRITTASGDGTARVWDAPSGRPLFILKGHKKGGVGWVAFSPNGQQIVTAGGDSTARVWDARKGDPLQTFEGHSDGVRSVAFSRDGTRLFTASDDQTAKVWDVASGEELLTLKGHEKTVYALAVSPDGQRIITCGFDNTAKVWQAATADQVAQWQKQEKDASQRLLALRREREATDELERTLRLQDPGTIRQWLVLSPLRFTNQSATAALDCEQVADEAHLHPLAGERIRFGDIEQAWRAVQIDKSMINFNNIDAQRVPRSLAYAVCYIHSETNQTGLSLRIGSSDECRVYLNGKPIYRWSEPRAYVPDRDVVPGVELQAGLNVLVFKLALEAFEDTDFDWQASIRFTDAADQEVKGIRATITPAFDTDSGAIHDWLLLAPITFVGTNGSTALAQEQIPDEAHLRPRAGDCRRAGETNLVWQEFHLHEYGLDFLQLTGRTNADWCVAYAVCYVESQTSQTNLMMKIGSDDQAKVYLNGKEIYRYDGVDRPLLPDEDEVNGVELKTGFNVLVFKVVNELLGWQGSIRFTDSMGQPVKGIRVTLTPP